MTDCYITTTGAAIGDIFQLLFVVSDTQGANSSVVRTVTVVSPCASSEYVCAGVCSAVACTTASTLHTLGGAASNSMAAPLLVLLPGPGTNFTQEAGRNKSLVVVYGQVPNVTLAPCTSSLPSDVGGCAAAAKDSNGTDLSGLIQEPTDVTECAADAVCVRCTSASLTYKTCPPGLYILAYTLVDGSSSSSVTAYLSVAVEQRTSTVLSFSIVNAASGSQADAQAFVDELQANVTLQAQVAHAYLPLLNISVASVRDLQLLDASVLPDATAVDDDNNSTANTTAAVFPLSLTFNVTTGSSAPLDLSPSVQAALATQPSNSSGGRRRRHLLQFVGEAVAHTRYAVDREWAAGSPYLSLLAAEPDGGTASSLWRGLAQHHAPAGLHGRPAQLVQAVIAPALYSTLLHMDLHLTHAAAVLSHLLGITGDESDDDDGGRRPSRLLLQTSTSTSTCGPSVTLGSQANISAMNVSAGGLIGVQSVLSSCSPAVVDVDALVLSSIAGAVSDIALAQSALLVVMDSMSATETATGNALDSRDATYNAQLAAFNQDVVDSYNNVTQRADQLLVLVSQTLAVQLANNAALQATTALLQVCGQGGSGGGLWCSWPITRRCRRPCCCCRCGEGGAGGGGGSCAAVLCVCACA